MAETWDKERRKVWGAIMDLKRKVKQLEANAGTTEGGRVEDPGLYHGEVPTDTLTGGAPGRA